jgi:hypothetical protein
VFLLLFLFEKALGMIELWDGLGVRDRQAVLTERIISPFIRQATLRITIL